VAAPTAVAADPAWSPDGKWIAFVELRSAPLERANVLKVVNVDGSGSRILTAEAEGLAWPTWSPDSRRVAFSSRASGAPAIWIINVDGTRLRRLLTDAFHPAWGPGGRRIAFNTATLDTDIGSIVVVRPDGRGERVAAVQRTPVAYEMPTWSPKGERLAFVAEAAPDTLGGGPRSLAVVDKLGGKVRQLSRARVNEPDWSPDGKRVAFTFGTPGGSSIRVLDLRKARTRALHAGSHPRWSPDSRRIVFADRGEIYVMNADGSGVRQVTS
jgi:TolB protein